MYFITQAVVKHMPAGGSVINISSQMGHVGAVNRSLYCASKSRRRRNDKSHGGRVRPKGNSRKHLVPDLYRNPHDKALL
ncbi:SDR family NAD(P)-dependent oxidoreductase [Vreelandella lionensis]|uniref:SDR family NAD(P)-dependent oxidoreductase n=1 Tax=Vreelandella lionensis TaxID=1144478 RepID=UPI0024365565|nr:SDR family NAD(P)-dependent oxidoreductase [Halomonas lionensis]